jgi:hypothetical protein
LQRSCSAQSHEGPEHPARAPAHARREVAQACTRLPCTACTCPRIVATEFSCTSMLCHGAPMKMDSSCLWAVQQRSVLLVRTSACPEHAARSRSSTQARDTGTSLLKRSHVPCFSQRPFGQARRLGSARNSSHCALPACHSAARRPSQAYTKHIVLKAIACVALLAAEASMQPRAERVQLSREVDRKVPAHLWGGRTSKRHSDARMRYVRHRFVAVLKTIRHGWHLKSRHPARAWRACHAA